MMALVSGGVVGWLDWLQRQGKSSGKRSFSPFYSASFLSPYSYHHPPHLHSHPHHMPCGPSPTRIAFCSWLSTISAVTFLIINPQIQIEIVRDITL
jgi:hypothetical protein